MTESNRITPPPAALLHPGAPTPEALTIAAEVRSNATIWFDPQAAPGYLSLSQAGFGALLIARLDASWQHAQQIQQWLIGKPPAGVPGTNREAALKDVIESLETGTPPAPFVEYVGLYLAGDAAHARYSLVLGMNSPVKREDYQDAWKKKLAALSGNASTKPWNDEIVQFMKLFFGQDTSQEEFVMLASTVGDLTDPKHFIISLLI
jgi:hypothetical protein